MKRNPHAIGENVAGIARDLAWQIVEASGYGYRAEFRDFEPLAIEFLARTPAVLQAAALAYAHGLNSFSLTVEDAEGNDVTDERPFKLAALDAFEAIATTFAARLAADELADIPPEQRRDWRDWHS